MERYLEDFQVGQTYQSGRVQIAVDQIKRFAAEFDPQPFHLDEAAARNTIFRGLAASGWHTVAATMKLLVDSDFRPAGGIIGVGFEGKWLKPVRPDDELRAEAEVLAVRHSQSDRTRGLITVRVQTFNQHEDVVQVATFTLVVPSRT